MKLQTAPTPEWLSTMGNQLSPRLRELIRQGAWIALNPTPEWLDELDRATAASNPIIAGDPTLVAAVTASNRINLIHFATAHLRDPGAPVTAYLGPEPLRMARLLMRRGLGPSALDVYRITQNVALQRWTDIVFELTADPDELHELLNIFSRSASDYVDATLAGLARQLKLEHSELAQGAVVERRKIVEAILAATRSTTIAPRGDWVTPFPGRTLPPSSGTTSTTTTIGCWTGLPTRSAKPSGAHAL